MCNADCIDYVAKIIKQIPLQDKKILETGAYNDNGSVRQLFLSHNPASYEGIDIVSGDGVDKVCSVVDLKAEYLPESFDIVVSTEMLEHVYDWYQALENMLYVLRNNGVLIVTTRSPGFPYHAAPYDYWRFTVDHIKQIFQGGSIDIASDTLQPGVFFTIKKTPELVLHKIPAYSMLYEKDLEIEKVSAKAVWEKYIKITGSLKLNLGCDLELLNGYVNIDQFPRHPQIVKMSVEKLEFADETVNGILAAHVLEHIPFRKTLAVLKEWYRVLGKKGACLIEVPDFEWAARGWLNAPEPTEWVEIDQYAGNTHRYSGWATTLWGNQDGPGQFHCTPFTEQRLILLMQKAGFTIKKNQKIFSHGAQALQVLGVK